MLYPLSYGGPGHHSQTCTVPSPPRDVDRGTEPPGSRDGSPRSTSLVRGSTRRAPRPAAPGRVPIAAPTAPIIGGGYAASDRGRSTCVALPPSGPPQFCAPAHAHSDPKEQQHDFTPPLQGGRPLPGRVRPQGDRAGRARDARPHGHAGRVRRQPAPGRRPHHRLAAHDRPDRGADRDADRPRRPRALGQLQHLLHPGPRGGRGGRRPRRHGGRPQGRARVRLEGRDASRSTGGAPSRPCCGPARAAPT